MALDIRTNPAIPDGMIGDGTGGGYLLKVNSDGSINSAPGTGAATGVAQASTTSGQTGTLVQGAVTTAAPTYVTAQTDPLSLDTHGGLRTTLQDANGTSLDPTTPVSMYRSSPIVTNISTKTTTTIKSGAGTFDSIAIQAGTADTITIYDSLAGSGTVLATWTVPAATMTVLNTGWAFTTGLTVVTGGTTAGNYTVGAR